MIGRENTMFIAFGIEGVGIWAALYARATIGLVRDPLRVGVFAWGEIYSLFPSTCTDTLPGSKFATTNLLACLYRQRHRQPCWYGSQITCSSPPAAGTRVFVSPSGGEYPRLAARDRVLKPGARLWSRTRRPPSAPNRTIYALLHSALSQGDERFFFARYLDRSDILRTCCGPWRIAPACCQRQRVQGTSVLAATLRAPRHDRKR